MRKSISPELIRKFLSRESTPEETSVVEAWYDSFESEPDPVPGLYPAEQQQLKDRMFSRVMENLRSMNSLPQSRSRLRVKRFFYVASGVAALLALVFGVGWLITRETPLPKADQAGTTSEIVVKNQENTIRRVDMPDGSTAWLRPHTTIRYPETFSGTRVLHLSGEAFFEVSRDPSHPFIIHSKQIVTRVLGTSFNIRAYQEDASAEVSVMTGKVAVQLEMPDKRGEEEVILLPNQKAVFGQENQLVEKQEYSQEKELQLWKKNTMAFDNVPVSQVVEVLNDAFDIEIQVVDEPLNDYVLKADFTSQNLPDILEMLERSLGVGYEIDGQRILLKSRK